MYEGRERKEYFKQYHFKMRQRERIARLKRKYGITNEEYEEMFKKQGGRCAACGKESNKVLCVDHDHKTGRIRGLLCNGCNVALGNLRDDSETIMKLYKYTLLA